MLLTPEQMAYRDRYASVCERLHSAPQTLIEKAVKAPARVPFAALTDAMPVGDVKAAIAGHLDTAAQCVLDARDAWPDTDISGHVTLRFAIDDAGTVQSIMVSDTDIQVEPVLCCMASVIEATTFPKAEGRSFIVVAYPFVIQPRARKRQR